MKMQSTIAFGVAALALATSGRAAVVVNEFDYDNVGTDNAEFVELYNPDSTPQDLTGMSLVFFNENGTAAVGYRTVVLTGSIPAGGYFTIGNIPSPSQSIGASVDAFQNGSPDGFGIYTGAAPTNATATNLVAGTGITYEGTNTAVPVEFLLVAPTAAEFDSNTVQGSLQRIPNGTGAFVFSTTPTPLAENVLTAVPEPTSLAAIAGVFALALRRRHA